MMNSLYIVGLAISLSLIIPLFFIGLLWVLQ